jgi:[amino group carrier protein]-L-2-aminoadipate 6-kinase
MTAAPLVVKLGGSITDARLVIDDLVAYRGPVVLVHGAHRVLDVLATRLGHPPRFITSTAGATSRFTDGEAMDHFLMAYCGLVNKRLVQQLLARGVGAVGLSAMDGGMVRGRRRPHVRVREAGRTLVLHGDHAGSIESVDDGLLRSLLDRGAVPVVCPPALGHDGVPINVDGDRLAVELAIAMGAPRVIILSDTAGFLADPADPSSAVRDVALRDLEGLEGAALGRARVKLAAVARGLQGGVHAVGICDGRGENPIDRALRGAGSWFSASGATVPA